MVYSRAIAVVLSTLVALSFNGVYGPLGVIDEKERTNTFHTRSIESNPKAIGGAEGILLKEDVGVVKKSKLETFGSTEEENTGIFYENKPLEKLATNLHFSNTAPDTTSRHLSAGCMTFKFIVGSTPQFDSGAKTGPMNYSDDGTVTGTKLSTYCAGNNCCNHNGIISDQCSDWNTDPSVSYEICPNSCLDYRSCIGIGKNSASGSVMRFGSNSCSSGGESCTHIAHISTSLFYLEIRENACQGHKSCFVIGEQGTNVRSIVVNKSSCTGLSSCHGIAYYTNDVQSIVIGSNSCKSEKSCFDAAARISSITDFVIEKNQCLLSQDCQKCVKNSSYTEGLQLTTQCCKEIEGEAAWADFDVACNGLSMAPSSIPSDTPSDMPSEVPSDQPSDQPSDMPSGVPSSLPSSVPSVSSSPSTVPSSIPSLSTQPSSEPTPRPTPAPTPEPCHGVTCNEGAGKCEVISHTDYKCVCETTFINTNNRRNCECPPGFIRKKDNRCYDPNKPVPSPQTKSPTKAPTASPTSAPTSGPSPLTISTSSCDDFPDRFKFTKKKILTCAEMTDCRCSKPKGKSLCPNACGATADYCGDNLTDGKGRVEYSVNSSGETVYKGCAFVRRVPEKIALRCSKKNVKLACRATCEGY